MCWQPPPHARPPSHAHLLPNPHPSQSHVLLRKAETLGNLAFYSSVRHQSCSRSKKSACSPECGQDLEKQTSNLKAVVWASRIVSASWFPSCPQGFSSSYIHRGNKTAVCCPRRSSGWNVSMGGGFISHL